jgi:hypothetical protein
MLFRPDVFRRVSSALLQLTGLERRARRPSRRPLLTTHWVSYTSDAARTSSAATAYLRLPTGSRLRHTVSPTGTPRPLSKRCDPATRPPCRTCHGKYVDFPSRAILPRSLYLSRAPTTLKAHPRTQRNIYVCMYVCMYADVAHSTVSLTPPHGRSRASVANPPWPVNTKHGRRSPTYVSVFLARSPSADPALSLPRSYPRVRPYGRLGGSLGDSSSSSAALRPPRL